MELVLTRHAKLAVERRGIKRVWLRQLVHRPDSTAQGDRFRTEIWRLSVEELGGRTLVAIIRPTRRKLRLVTAYLEGA
ncbi:MAG: DUF4258 domain-containing protein [Pseudomonadota bacterium]